MLYSAEQREKDAPSTYLLPKIKKNLYFSLLVTLLTLTTLGAAAGNSNLNPREIPSKETIALMTKEQKDARVAEMKERVKEIKSMDKSTLTRSERKALRMELKDMNKEAKAMAVGGVYISIGALIIIILLLIIIL